MTAAFARRYLDEAVGLAATIELSLDTVKMSSDAAVRAGFELGTGSGRP
jgi:hypothetical protein